MVAQHATQLLLRSVVERILQIDYENYRVFGKTADDDAEVRSQHAAEHAELDSDVADIVEQDARTWQFAPQITSDDCQRLQRINQLLRAVLRKQPVRKEQLRKALTAEQLSAYTASLREAVTPDEALYADGAPHVLKRYNVLLRAADFVYNRAARMSAQASTGQRRFTANTRSAIYQRADTLYERALEYLAELIEGAQRDHTRGQLLMWLDRDVDLSADGNTSLSPDGVPRVKGSRSHHAYPSAALPKMNQHLKRELRQLQALISAAEKIAYLPDLALAEQQQRDADKSKAAVAARRAAQLRMQHLNSERD